MPCRSLWHTQDLRLQSCHFPLSMLGIFSLQKVGRMKFSHLKVNVYLMKCGTLKTSQLCSPVAFILISLSPLTSLEDKDNLCWSYLSKYIS